MSDHNLRDLERQAAQAGTPEALDALERAARRAGAECPAAGQAKARALARLPAALASQADPAFLLAPCCGRPVRFSPAHASHTSFRISRAVGCPNMSSGASPHCGRVYLRLNYGEEMTAVPAVAIQDTMTAAYLQRARGSVAGHTLTAITTVGEALTWVQWGYQEVFRAVPPPMVLRPAVGGGTPVQGPLAGEMVADGDVMVRAALDALWWAERLWRNPRLERLLPVTAGVLEDILRAPNLAVLRARTRLRTNPLVGHQRPEERGLVLYGRPPAEEQ